MGKSKSITIGYWYYPAFLHGLCKGPIDAFLEVRGAEKTAWSGELTASGAISINNPNLWGGEKDQGGMVGTLRVMMGEADQERNAYLTSTFGPKMTSWRGFCTVAWEGGKYGAMNPWPQTLSYKIRTIKAIWDDGECWYPDKAEIPFGQGSLPVSQILYDDLALKADVYIGPPTEPGRYFLIDGLNTTDVLSITVPGGLTYVAWSRFPLDTDNGGKSWGDGFWVTDDNDVTTGYLDEMPGSDNTYFATASEAATWAAGQPPSLITGSTSYRIHLNDWVVNLNRGGISLRVVKMTTAAGLAMNPAHMMVFARTQKELGREPLANINAASAEAAADWFYAHGFGLCTKRQAASESPASFERRICRVAGCSFNRSAANGQWYIDIANGEYVFDDLPILTDDDVLSFREIPAVLDNAINSVSVRYFDPVRKEKITTPPLRAMGLIAAFGENHKTYDFLEIPSSDLALRVAARELRSTTTPTRAIDLTTTRKTYAWRPNQYFRLQLPKRGIDDMVCLVGELQHGQLKSGAIKLKAAQDIYSLPETAYAQSEPGVDTRPSQVPVAIVDQVAFEAPYVDVVAAMSRADLAALPLDTGFLVGVAADPATSRDFAMRVAPSGGEYQEVATGDFCPTALTVEAADKSTTDFTLSNALRLQFVEVGDVALWGSEWCRVDAIDATAGTISLGRGCADTVPHLHAAGSRLYFYGAGAAADTTEYAEGEAVDVKLLTNTGSQQLAESEASALEVTFGERQARPYPPANLAFADDLGSGKYWPTELFGDLTISWAHRDRVLQADQLVDTTAANIGPEAGTTYTMRTYLDGVLVDTQSGIPGTSATVTPGANGVVRVEVESERDDLVSWQYQVHQFSYSTTTNNTRVVKGGNRRVTVGGNVRVSRG